MHLLAPIAEAKLKKKVEVVGKKKNDGRRPFAEKIVPKAQLVKSPNPGTGF